MKVFAHSCHGRITIANRLDPDQARQNDQDPICLTIRWYFCNIFFKEVAFLKNKKKRNQQTTKTHGQFPEGQSVCLIV